MKSTLEKTCLVIAQMNQYESHSIKDLKLEKIIQKVEMSRPVRNISSRREVPMQYYEDQRFPMRIYDPYTAAPEVIYPRLTAEVIFLPLK
jgi:hypothetical protein